MEAQPRLDTPPQRAVRALAALAFVLVCASGPVLYAVAPHVRTLGGVALPRLVPQDVLRGTWQQELERHLRESSPATYHLRGIYCEQLLGIGWLDSRRVHIGQNGWYFLTDELSFPAERFRAETGQRRAAYRALNERLGRLGVRCVVVLIPDKTRTYADLLMPPARYPSDREALYGTVLEELREAGFGVADVLSRYAQARHERPDEPLWYARDTHWNGAGMTHAALAAKDELERLGWTGLLQPPERIEPLYRKVPEVVEDIMLVLGVRKESERARKQAEPRDVCAARSVEVGAALELSQPGAGIALAGTSFSNEGLAALLSIALQRRVDAGSVHAGWLAARCLRDVTERIERHEIMPKVVIWEVPERLEIAESWDEITAPR